MAQRISVVAAAALVCLLSGTTALLSGCVASVSGAPASPSATTSATSTASTPQPTDSATIDPAAGPTPTAEPTPSCMRADGGGIILPSGLLNVDMYSRMHDYGAREGATGAAQYADDGSLASYEVASGDYEDAILDRFCVGVYYLDALNAVRRGGATSVDPTRAVYPPDLHVGDELNLSPYTITTVGDVNGEVFAYETSFTLPPQR
nr:hypothetical protein [Microbacterium hydrocarbonoxydans]